jgi:6-phosphofructokinase 1
MIKTIGLLCSGGDSSGMNCVIRSVVRSAISKGVRAFGIKRGFEGLIEGNIYEMNLSSVGNILHHGGTTLQTSRSEKFKTKEGRSLAIQQLKKNYIDALIVIGGNGSFKGAYTLGQEYDFPVIGIPGTIDNDIAGTDYTIGFDTAVQNAINAVDKIRDTASSHERTFIVEVMGRKSPAIAHHVGISTGAENIIIPGSKIDYQKINNDIQRGISRGKNSSIIIVAESDTPGFSYEVKSTLKNNFQLDAHVCILGHTQRGGGPTHTDRFIGSQMGFHSVDVILSGKKSSAIIYTKGKVKDIDLIDCTQEKKELKNKDLELLQILAI